MDIQTIDRSYAQLESQSQQTIQALTALAQKLQTAGQAGDQNARMLQRFMGGGFGRAVAMGAGFGIGDDIINSIF